VARSALSYQGRKAAKDAAAIARMRELSAQYPRYGYRRLDRGATATATRRLKSPSPSHP
jgi:hypothetical protein